MIMKTLTYYKGHMLPWSVSFNTSQLTKHVHQVEYLMQVSHPGCSTTVDKLKSNNILKNISDDIALADIPPPPPHFSYHILQVKRSIAERWSARDQHGKRPTLASLLSRSPNLIYPNSKRIVSFGCIVKWIFGVNNHFPNITFVLSNRSFLLCSSSSNFFLIFCLPAIINHSIFLFIM